MKKILFPSLIAMSLSLSACSEEKDQAYYLKNISKAEAKQSECGTKLTKAMQAKDEAAFKRLLEDAECKAAEQAIKEDKRIKREQEAAAKAALLQAEIDKEKARLQQELGDLDWKATAHYFVNSDCAKYGIDERGFGIPEQNYTCRALAQLYKAQAEIGKDELVKFSYEELKSQEKTYCQQDKRKYSACSIWEEALAIQAEPFFEKQEFAQLEKQAEEYSMWRDNHPISERKAFEKIFKAKEQAIIESYIKDYASLKQTYNQCVEQLKQIGDHWKKHKERATVTQFYPCSQAQTARTKLGLGYDDFKTLME